MTLLDLRKLAIKCQLTRETMDDPLRTYYAWANDVLLRAYNNGAACFREKLRQVINSDTKVYCPWDHVGKNH